MTLFSSRWRLALGLFCACPCYFAEAVPSNVTATRGEKDRIVVQWSGTNTYYQVYNQTVAVSGWVATNGFVHTAASRGVLYRYRVKESASADGSGASAYSTDTTAAIGFLGFPLTEYVSTNSVPLTLDSSGTRDWVGQYAANGVDQQLVSGLLNNYGESTSLSISVRGGGTLSFDWKVDSDVINNGLYLYINESEVWESPMTADPNWSHISQVMVASSEEEQTVVRIAYEKFGTGSGLDCAWIANLVWTPAAPLRLDPPCDVEATGGEMLEQVVVSWSPVGGASYYRVWRASASNGVDRVDVSGGWQSATSVVDVSSEIQGGDTYWYFVEAAKSDAGDNASYLSLPAAGYALKRAVNDYLGEALELDSVVMGAVTGSCAGATVGSGEPVHGGVASATNSVWWMWISPYTGSIRFSVRGLESDLPLVIAAYTNADSNLNLSTLVGVESGQLGTNGWATCDVSVLQGVTYYFAVAGQDGKAGPLELSWDVSWSKAFPTGIHVSQGSLFGGVGVSWDPVQDATHYEVWRRASMRRPDAEVVGTWQQGCTFVDTTVRVGLTYYYAVRATVGATDLAASALSDWHSGFAGTYPPNDNWISATSITGNVGIVAGSLEWATYEFGEPVHADVLSATNSVWWVWSAPTNACYSFTVTPGSNECWRPVIAVYMNGSDNAWMSVAASVAGDESGSSQVTFDAVGGQSYRVAIAGYDGAGGSFTLEWAQTLATPTNVCATDGTLFWGAVIEWDAVPGAMGYEVSRSLEINGEKEVLAGDLTDTTFEDWTGDIGVSYFYFVRAKSALYGGLISAYSWPALGSAGDFPLNDDRVCAVPLTGVTGTIRGNSTFATREVGEPQHAGFSDAGASIWWTWTASVSAPVTFATTGDEAFDAVLAVYTNAGDGALISMAAAERGTNSCARVSFNTGSGTTYLVALAGRPNAGGAAVLGWSYGDWTLSAPENIQASQGTSPVMTVVTWAAVPDAECYEVLRAETTDGPRTVLQSWSGGTSFQDTSAVPGKSYYYFVRAAVDDTGTMSSGYGGPAQGWIAARPVNDSWLDAIVFSNALTQATGDNTWATFDADEPQHAGLPDATNSVWWVWTAQRDGTALFDTQGSAFSPSVLAVYTGVSPTWSSVASAESGTNGYAQVNFEVTSGTTYHVAVAGREGAEGSIVLNCLFTATGDIGPSVVPTVHDVSVQTTGGNRTMRLTFDVEEGCTYEVVTTSRLGNDAVWASLTPVVQAIATEAGTLTLEVPMTDGTAFFKVVATR